MPLGYGDGSSAFKDIAGDVARLNVAPETGLDTDCVNDVFAPKPCPDVLRVWEEFTERHGLPPTRETAEMLRAYIIRDYRRADRLYARAKGFQLPDEPPPSLSSIGSEIAALGVPREQGTDTACTNDLLSPKPCQEAMRAWGIFARKHNLQLNAQTARMFYAYLQGDHQTGDELYASLGQTASRKAPRNPIHADVLAYGVPREEGTDTACVNNPMANKPCLAAVRAWKQFSAEHDLPLDRQSADAFQAYVEGDPIKGDKLYAAAKGISVAQLLQERGIEVDEPVEKPLRVPIFPSGSQR